MPVRPGMAPLITEVRWAVGDTAAAPVFSDDQVQDALDDARTWHEDERIDHVTFDYDTNRYGAVQAYDRWESAVLKTALGEVLAPTTSDLKEGRWTFAPGLVDPAVYVTGWTYDVKAAAVQVVDWWLAKLKLEYDVSVGGDSFSRSQKVKNLTELRDRLAGESATKGGIRTSKTYRSDQGRGR